MGELDEQANTNTDLTEHSVHEVILDMLEHDSAIDSSVKNAVLEALAEVVGGADQDRQNTATPTYLTEISVVGFRGIGNQARLELHPAPGLTVVSGRNGSGKSSFAEALELALTGTSYRWHKKETLWAESWRNLHRPEPCAIRVGFTAEGAGPFTVGADWASGASLSERTFWTQVGTDSRLDGTDGLGWTRPLELFRPVLSYDELGKLFDGGPSALYDALAKLLGLEVLADAEKSLATQLKSTKVTREHADEERKRIVALLADSEDERANRATSLLKKRGGAPLEEVLALVTGSDPEGQAASTALRTLAQLQSPTVDEIVSTSSQLRAALRSTTEAAGTLADGTRERVDLLQAALRFHDHLGDAECPVCGRGRVDSDWAEETVRAITRAEATLGEYRTAAAELERSRSAAIELIGRVETFDEVNGLDLQALATYRDAAAVAHERPAGDEELAAHLESALVTVAAAADSLRAEAADALAKRENTWAPIAAQIGGWVPIEQGARELDGTVKTMTAAKKWMNDHAGPFRNLRLEAIAAHARKIWGQLRQESNVGLCEITLQGSATRRRAVLGGSVDGQPTKALSVMSQGELHALALALFLPRATAVNSPFRFVVLDDPIQAMDPSKIDGFLHVLSDIAKTHQVVVFSHDDRLASMIRETGTDAMLVEVVREAGSKVTVRDNVNPALRQVNDVFALLNETRLPDEIRTRVMPGLFRLAVEAAARQAYYARQSLGGRSRAESENEWTAAKKTVTRLALAVLGDPTADLTKWLDAKPERRRTLRVCNAVHNDRVDVSIEEAKELKRTVKTLLALQ